MKQKYEKPEMEVFIFITKDIMMSSGDEDEIPGFPDFPSGN